MACRYTYRGKTYEAFEFDDVLRALPVSVAAKYMDGVKPTPEGPFIGKDPGPMLDLALKRIMRYAAENGYDKVAFINGEQSADRYDLSKQVDVIYAGMSADGKYLIGADQGRNRDIIDKKVTKEELPDLVGKELADKIVRDVIDEDTNAEYKGLYLKVGGYGMVKFYDQILPQRASALLKNLGGKMETVRTQTKEREKSADSMGFDKSEIVIRRDASGNWLVEKGDAYVAPGEGKYWNGSRFVTKEGDTRMFSSEAAAQASVFGTEQPGFTVPVAAGQPMALFSFRRALEGQYPENNFIVPETSAYKNNVGLLDIGYLDGKPIRLNVGKHNSKTGKGYGIMHLLKNAAEKNGRAFERTTDDEAEDAVNDLINLMRRPDLALHSDNSQVLRSLFNRRAIILNDVGEFYSVTTIRPADVNVWGEGNRIAAGRLTFPADAAPGAAISDKGINSGVGQALSPNGQEINSTKFNPTEVGKKSQPAPRLMVVSDVPVTQKKRRAVDVEAMKADGLKESKRRQTETPEFKTWFGDTEPVTSRSGLVLSRQSAISESGADGRSGNTKSLTDLFVSKTFGLKGLGGFDVPTQRKMLDGVVALGDDLEVLRSVVELITVDVMNILSRQNLAPESLFSNKAMLKKLLSADINGSVSTAVDVADALVLGVARVAAKRSAVSSNPFAGSKEGSSAPNAGDFNEFHASSLSGIKLIGNNGNFDPTKTYILESKRRIVGDSGRTYDPEQRNFFSNVGRDIEEKNLLERTRDYLAKDFAKKMATGIVDQFRGLKDLGPGGMQAYLLARLSKGTAGAFDAFLHHGKLKLRDNVYDADRSGGFVQRLGVALNGELDDFLWWVAANRAEKLAPQDREHLFTPQDIATGKTLANGTTTWDYTIQAGPSAGRVTRNRSEIFADANRVFGEFQKNAMDMAEQSGLIDGSTRKYWENEFYVPFYRVSEEDNEFVGLKMGNALVRQQAFKKLKGGTDKLQSDLLSNTLLNFSHLIEASAKNRAAKASLEAAEAAGAAHKALPGEKKTVWFMDGGQKVEYKVDDPFVMTAITSLEYAGMNNPIMKALSQFKHWLTVGVTASPAFKVRNLIRDSVQAIGTSDLGYNPFKNVAEGWKQTNRDSQEYVSALASGGLIRFGTMLEGSESARTRQLIKAGVKNSSILDNESKINRFYDRFLEPAISAYNEIGNRGEEINRAALYNQMIKQGKSHAEAALLARDLMDFSMQGAFTGIRFLTQVVPFMNARLQGMYKLGRAAKDNPKKMAIVTGAVAMASIGLLLAYGDDDEWKRRPDWDRDNYWWFKVGGLAFRIPKPFELGAVGTLAERGLEYMINDEMTGERFRKVTSDLVLNNLSMNPIPQMVKPIIDIYANKDSFTGKPIENMSQQRLEPTMRYNANTSMPARAASQAMMGALSPMQIDHLVRGYFSWLGSFVVGGADMAARLMSNEPTRPTMDYWRFATQGLIQEQGSGSSRYINQMYDQAKELEQAHATWRQLIKDGKVEEAKSYRDDKTDELKRYPRVEAIKKVESNYNERIRRIERSGIDPDQKKVQIENIQKLKEAAAQRIAPGY